MENERHYFLVGLFVLGGVLAIFIFSIWLTATDDSKYLEYRIHFAESVSGLEVALRLIAWRETFATAPALREEFAPCLAQHARFLRHHPRRPV